MAAVPSAHLSTGGNCASGMTPRLRRLVQRLLLPRNCISTSTRLEDRRGEIAIAFAFPGFTLPSADVVARPFPPSPHLAGDPPARRDRGATCTTRRGDLTAGPWRDHGLRCALSCWRFGLSACAIAAAMLQRTRI
jgi:hypothetical protein